MTLKEILGNITWESSSEGIKEFLAQELIEHKMELPAEGIYYQKLVPLEESSETKSFL